MSLFMDKILSRKSAVKILSCCAALLYSASSSAAYQMADDAWKVEIAPYIWAMNMNGTVQIGPVRAHVDQSFSDILDHLNFAGMIYMDVSKNNLDFFVNLLYAVLTDNDHNDLVSVHVQNKFGIFTGGLSTEICRHAFSSTGSIGFDPYVGFRTTLNDVSVKLYVGPFTLKGVNNQNWTDPIIGLKLPITLNKAWSIVLAGDVGGMNTTTQYSYNVQGLLGYSPQSHWTNTTVYLGYRLLDQHYQHGKGLSFNDWNMKIAGPLLGLAIKL
jgi:hypothetical protein